MPTWPTSDNKQLWPFAGRCHRVTLRARGDFHLKKLQIASAPGFYAISFLGVVAAWREIANDPRAASPIGGFRVRRLVAHLSRDKESCPVLPIPATQRNGGHRDWRLRSLATSDALSEFVRRSK